MAGEMTVVVSANLVADPKVVTIGDKAVTKLQLAHNTRSKRGDEWVADEVWWLDASVWPRFPDDPWPRNVAESLRKGDAVEITGRLKRDLWESRDGRQGVSYRLMVASIGPSLCRATVSVTRNNQAARAAGRDGWGAGGDPQPWGQAAAAAPLTPEGSSAPTASTGTGSASLGFDEEEPF